MLLMKENFRSQQLGILIFDFFRVRVQVQGPANHSHSSRYLACLIPPLQLGTILSSYETPLYILRNIYALAEKLMMNRHSAVVGVVYGAIFSRPFCFGCCLGKRRGKKTVVIQRNCQLYGVCVCGVCASMCTLVGY